MLRSRLFWKLFATFSVVNLVAALALMQLTLRWFEEQALEDARQRLTAAAVLAAETFGPQLQAPASAGVQERVARVGDASGFRLTLIDREGRVLADSAQRDLAGVRAMENHAQRPEVIRALRGEEGVGFDRRTSVTTGRPHVYLARRVEARGDPAGVVRAALPGEEIDGQLARLREQLWAVLLVAEGAVLVVTYAVVRSIVSPLVGLNRAAQAIARGDYQQRAFVTTRDELGELAASFNRMSHELAAQFDELRESGARQATVLGGMVEGVIAVDRREQVLFANTAAAELFRIDREHVEGRPLIEVVRNHMLHDAVVESLAAGEPRRLEIEGRGPEKLCLSVQVTPLPGEPVGGAVIVLHDTTELRRLETIRQEFIANVSHELKTPLSSIKAYTETLLGGAWRDPEHSQKFLRRIEEQAERLNALIQDMLSLARIEGAQQPLELISVPVSEAVAACLDDYGARAHSRGVELAAESGEPQLQVRAEPEGLRVLLNNLVDNAVKYTPSGGRVTLSWRSLPTGRARIDVTDTGVGIPEEELPRVFERFHRVDRARSRELGGTGLGLSIVKHLAQQFGGSVSVNSRMGEGATFSVELPTA